MRSFRSAIITFLSLAGALHAGLEFCVFDNGLTDIKSAEDQAALLQKIGYDGICTRPQNATADLFAAMDRHRIKISATYVVLPAKDAEKPLPPELADHLQKLKGRKTIVWLALTQADASDESSVSVIRKVCDLASQYSLEVVLYPHVGMKTSTTAACERLRSQADRPNLGVSFNLCHFLCQNDADELETTLKSVAPHLKLVQISGADAIPPGKPDWKHLIQPLGKGTFDTARVFRTLKEIGYSGPVNLQCYQIKLPAEQHLSASMAAWKELSKSPGKP